MKAQQLMRSPRKGRAHHCERKITRETVSNTAVLHFRDVRTWQLGPVYHLPSCWEMPS